LIGRGSALRPLIWQEPGVLNRTSTTVMLSLPLGCARQCPRRASQMNASPTSWTTTFVRGQ
jgi:hypothetical protein